MNEFVRAPLTRVLAIGSHAAAAVAVEDDRIAMLIVMEPDPVLADDARRRFAASGNNAVVIGGDPRRMLYKLAGPFDAILYDVQYETIRPTLDQLLVSGGVMIPVS